MAQFQKKSATVLSAVRAALVDTNRRLLIGYSRWPTAKGDLTTMRHTIKEIIRAAGLRDELSFTSFRHGGHTEAADSDLTDAEIRAQSRHKSNVLPRDAKRTMKQVAAGAKKRRATRTEVPVLSE